MRTTAVLLCVWALPGVAQAPVDVLGDLPDAVTAIALMVDTDDTGGRATAWYDDVVLR